MDATQIIREIDTYLSLYPIEIEGQPFFSADIMRSGALKTAKPLNGMQLIAASDKDENLEKLIDHCSEEMLDELVQTFGEDSPIANIIRIKNAKTLRQRTACDYETIRKSLEDALK